MLPKNKTFKRCVFIMRLCVSGFAGASWTWAKNLSGCHTIKETKKKPPNSRDRNMTKQIVSTLYFNSNTFNIKPVDLFVFWPLGVTQQAVDTNVTHYLATVEFMWSCVFGHLTNSSPIFTLFIDAPTPENNMWPLLPLETGWWQQRQLQKRFIHSGEGNCRVRVRHYERDPSGISGVFWLRWPIRTNILQSISIRRNWLHLPKR